MENNIFKNAKFGDRFRTRDNRWAIYVKYRPSKINGLEYHYCIVDGKDDFDGYLDTGHRGLGVEQGIDIISRYHEPINEDKLEKLAEDERLWYRYEHEGCSNTVDDNVYKDAFKAGYRKAMEE